MMIKSKLLLSGLLLLGTVQVFAAGLSDSNRKETPQPGNPKLSWKKTDKSLALLNASEVVWQLNFDRGQDKPYFHPLRTLTGHNLTFERPVDHPWHRGLWFSWKLMNGVNYWEENPKTGLSEGRSRITKVDIRTDKDFGATVTFALEYAPEGHPHALLTEKRIVTISAPDQKGNYQIDWNLHFKAGDTNLILDRQAPLKHGGVNWGGYGGLSFRAAETLTGHHYLASNGWMNDQSLTGYGEKASWMDLSAVVDSDSGARAGLTIFDHPRNPGHPSPWYVWFDIGKHAFFTPALLFDAPIQLLSGQSLDLRYRVLVHSGKGEKAKLDEAYQKFIK